jgi:hypothetical protein
MPEDEEPRGGSRPGVRQRPSKQEEAQPPVSTSVVRNVTLTLEEFGRTLLEAQARTFKVPPAAIVRQGALYFLSERGSERTATKIPRFASERTQGGEELELAVTLDEADWAALEEEAKRQHVSLERLLVHAALLLLADLETRPVMARILDEDEDEKEL